VRGGKDAYLPKLEETPLREGTAGHKAAAVYREMLLQICRDYAGLPDPRTLSMSEIRFFYEGVRHEIREATKPRQP
jgi:hypothetical protein